MRRSTKSMGVVPLPVEDGSPKSGVRGRTLRAGPPPPTRRPTLPQIYAINESGETSVNAIVRELARLSDPTCIPVLTRPIGPADGLAPQEAYVASLLGESATIQMIVDVSPMGEDGTMRFLARLITTKLVTIEHTRPRHK